MQIRGDTVTAQDLRELLQLVMAGDTDREVIKPDPVLAEPVAGRRIRQWRTQHQASRLAYPQPELLAREVLINLQPQDPHRTRGLLGPFPPERPRTGRCDPQVT